MRKIQGSFINNLQLRARLREFAMHHDQKSIAALQTHYTNGEEFLIDHLSSTRNSSLHEKLSLARLTFTGVGGCMSRLRSTWLEVRDEKFICSVHRRGPLCADGRDFGGRKNP